MLLSETAKKQLIVSRSWSQNARTSLSAAQLAHIQQTGKKLTQTELFFLNQNEQTTSQKIQIEKEHATRMSQ